MDGYRAPRWLPGAGALGGNLQTIWPALWSRRFEGVPPDFDRERWNTPDGDFIDVDWMDGAPGAGVPAPPPEGVGPALGRPGDGAVLAAKSHENAPLLVLFHGLEGSSSSHYAQAFAHLAQRRGWRFAVPHFRGCSGELNLAPRAYHSGDFEEVGWVLDRFRARHTGPLLVVGVSLGGNAMLRWAEEAGGAAARIASAVAAVSSPIDLAAGGAAIGRGFNRLVYTRMFLRTMKPKALAKLAQHPGLFDREALLAARDLYEFDNVFTAPLHGFRDTDDYWTRGSAKPRLADIRVPALVLNARNDPFIPAHSLPAPHQVGAQVTLWQPAHGGHVGFPGGRFPGHVLHLPRQVMDWLAAHLPSSQGVR